MSAPSEVRALVKHFIENRESYEAAQFNEAQTRIQFLNPLFRALGWDVDNREGYAEAYKDVVHEDALKVGSATKAPDYSFRIGGVRKFFLEAKKPAISIKDNADAAFQLRRYAWSAKLPLSLLSNFSSLAVYDCRAIPTKTDRASTARIHYWTCDRYEDAWDEIASIFSKEAILRGSFDKFVAGARAKRGTAEVDSEFLREIESWRAQLARNIALRNPGLSQGELNFAVQQTIDRIIFLRICEDRGIEPYGTLLASLRGERVYEQLRLLYHRADARYNSGLFHFNEEKGRPHRPDNLTLSLKLDDKPLREIVQRLYYPDSPYEFSVLSADILGQVYEQFLGKVIRLTAGGHAKIDEKPEVKKAGGVFYTPSYVVDHIVKQTVGHLLANKTIKSLRTLTIIDPACGSGSFLLSAYQTLLDWYLQQYLNDGAEANAKGRRPKLFRAEKKGWRLTTAERKRILLQHIYGVDIDPQAVEVTKLSLLLKVLEDESAETLGKNQEMFHERALPDLDNNIKCGNSLIAHDVFEGALKLAPAEHDAINAFDWENEFCEIFDAGGFDVLIGNPPYHSVKLMAPSAKAYFAKTYTLAIKRFNLYSLFIERSKRLLRQQGMIGLIVPSALLANAQYEELRHFLLTNFAIDEIVSFRGSVFQAASIETMMFVAHRESDPARRNSQSVLLIDDLGNFLRGPSSQRWRVQSQILESENSVIEMGASAVGRRYPNTVPLKDVAIIRNGINTGNIADEIVTTVKRNAACRKLIDGKDVQRYEPPHWQGKYVIYDDEYVERLRRTLEKKGIPWTARIIKEENYFEREKLLVQRIRNLSLERRLVFTYDGEGYYTSINIGVVFPKDGSPLSIKYLLGILNSRFMNQYFAERFRTIQIKNAFLETLPIRAVDFAIPDERAKHDAIVGRVDRLLKLQAQLASSRGGHEVRVVQRQIEALDRQLDAMVAALYGAGAEDGAATG